MAVSPFRKDSLFNLKIMQALLLCILCTFYAQASDVIRFNFGQNKDGNNWQITNDGVMGGLSIGKTRFKENSILFTGTVSLENNGGFTSFRTPFQAFDLTKVQKVEIRYRSKGQDMGIMLENSRQFFRPYFKYDLVQTDNEWTTVMIDISEFKLYVLGRKGNQKIASDFLSSVLRIGLITSSKAEGPFSFEIDYLSFQ